MVLENALPLGITHAKIGLGFGKTLVCGLSKPLHCFGIVLGSALPHGVAEAKVVLCLGNTLFCSLSIPLHRFGMVLGNAGSSLKGVGRGLAEVQFRFQ